MAWTPHWSDESLPLIDRVAELGLDFIEIPLMDVEDVHPAPIRARLDTAGIDVVTSTVLSASTDITSADPEVRAAGLAYLRRCVDVTAEMGASQFSGVIYGMHGKRPPRRPGQEEWDWSAECLAQVAEHAAAAGLTIGLEPVNRYESPLLNTCAQAVQLADMIGAPNVKIHLDTYHMNIEETGWREPVALAGDPPLPLPPVRERPRHPGHRPRRLGRPLRGPRRARLRRLRGPRELRRRLRGHGRRHVRLARPRSERRCARARGNCVPTGSGAQARPLSRRPRRRRP